MEGGGEYLSREESGVSGEMGERVDIVMVGGEGVGKGCLGIRFVSNHYVVEYDPTLEDGYVKCVEVDGERVGVVVKHHNVTESSYRTADGFVLTYSVACAASLGVLGRLYDRIVEIRGGVEGGVVAVMVGTKTDLDREVERREAEEVAAGLGGGVGGEGGGVRGGVRVFEVSAKEDGAEVVTEPFFELVRRIRMRRREGWGEGGGGGKKKKCSVM